MLRTNKVFYFKKEDEIFVSTLIIVFFSLKTVSFVSISCDSKNIDKVYH